MTCKHCGKELSESNITDGELAICDSCSALNNLSTQPLSLPHTGKAKTKRKNSTPRNLQLMETSEGLKIRFYWLSRQHWTMLILFVFWDTVIFASMSDLQVGLANDFFWTMVYILVMGFVGLALGYFTVQGFLNHTDVVIAEDGIHKIVRPIPSWDHPDKFVDRTNIMQVFCMRRTTTSSREKPHYEYDLYYIDADKTKSVLVRGVATYEEALYIEQQIEGAYGIENVPHAKEWRDSAEFDDSSEKIKKGKRG